MADTNNLNPEFVDMPTALGYKTRHGKGVGVVAVTLQSTTADVNVFGSTNGFTGTITGVFMASVGATGTTVTLTNGGTTVCTMTGVGEAGSVVAPASALANTALTASGTTVLTSDSASDTGIVYITYIV